MTNRRYWLIACILLAAAGITVAFTSLYPHWNYIATVYSLLLGIAVTVLCWLPTAESNTAHSLWHKFGLTLLVLCLLAPFSIAIGPTTSGTVTILEAGRWRALEENQLIVGFTPAMEGKIFEPIILKDGGAGIRLVCVLDPYWVNDVAQKYSDPRAYEMDVYVYYSMQLAAAKQRAGEDASPAQVLCALQQNLLESNNPVNLALAATLVQVQILEPLQL